MYILTMSLFPTTLESEKGERERENTEKRNQEFCIVMVRTQRHVWWPGAITMPCLPLTLAHSDVVLVSTS